MFFFITFFVFLASSQKLFQNNVIDSKIPRYPPTQPPIISQPYRDIVCPKYKTSKEKLAQINYGKSMGFGSFSCIQTVVLFNSDGSLNFSTSFPSSYITHYNETIGAIVTELPDGGRNEEYSGDNNIICLNENQVELKDFYTESYDISKGGVGNAARFIQSYEKTSGRKLRRIQHLVITEEGENIFIALLDQNQKYVVSGFQTCTRL